MSDGHNGFEQMAKFFDRRVETYEAHMQEIMPTFHEFYSLPTRSLSIPGLRCGTGLELDFVFQRAPGSWPSYL